MARIYVVYMDKPSERIDIICREICAERGRHQPSSADLEQAMPYAIARYLDEQAETKAGPGIAEVAGNATGPAPAP